MSRPVRWLDDEFELQEGEALERNGNLTLVEGRDGELRWLAPFEIEED